MSKAIEVDALTKEIAKALEDYEDDISEVVEEVSNKIGKEAVEEVKQKSPKKRGSYAKGWTLKKDKQGKGKYSVKIHNKTDYQLTHLLEFGHATRNGGRTKAIPHIRPVEQKYVKEYEQELKRKLGGKK